MASTGTKRCRVCLVKSSILHNVYSMCDDRVIADLMRKILEINDLYQDEGICCKCLHVLEEANELRQLAAANRFYQNANCDVGLHKNSSSNSQSRSYPANYAISTARPFLPLVNHQPVSFHQLQPSFQVTRNCNQNVLHLEESICQLRQDHHEVQLSGEERDEFPPPANHESILYSDDETAGDFDDFPMMPRIEKTQVYESVNRMEMPRYQPVFASTSFDSYYNGDAQDFKDDDDEIAFFINLGKENSHRVCSLENAIRETKSESSPETNFKSSSHSSLTS